jgi:hypothetical protein
VVVDLVNGRDEIWWMEWVEWVWRGLRRVRMEYLRVLGEDDGFEDW